MALAGDQCYFQTQQELNYICNTWEQPEQKLGPAGDENMLDDGACLQEGWQMLTEASHRPTLAIAIGEHTD